MADDALIYARWHRALDDLSSEPDGPIRDHIEAHDARVRRDLAAKVEALHHPDSTGEFCDHCWTGPDSHGNGSSPWWPCETVQLLADALAGNGAEEPGNGAVAGERASGASTDVRDAAGLSGAQETCGLEFGDGYTCDLPKGHA